MKTTNDDEPVHKVRESDARKGCRTHPPKRLPFRTNNDDSFNESEEDVIDLPSKTNYISIYIKLYNKLIKIYIMKAVVINTS